MLTPEQAVLAAILICVFGAVIALMVSARRTLAGWVAFALTTASAALIFSGVGAVLIHGPSQNSAVFWAMPSIGFALRLHVDGLTAVFLLLAAVIAVPAALYSISYMDHYREYGVGRYYPYFLLFLAAMYGLLSTTDMMWFFFIFWQLMTLPGYALIRFEHRKRQNIRAANKYLLMMQIACVATLIGAEILADAGATTGAGVRYDFDTVTNNLPGLLTAHPALAAVAFGLFLVGFGIKMGMWPFGQVWLPDAHPAAPSPVSALLSGVMIKTGVYGLMRYFLWLAPAGAQSVFPLSAWGLVVATLGTVTLFTGTMQALKQEQTKRLLAFHSIGQVGYILLGLGTCMAVLPGAGPAAASLAAMGLLGALFHTLNHGVFKALLFLNSGSMLRATGTQDLNQMGGLLRFMPLTAVTALVASLSISGVPLFNGFASKWCIYVAAVRGSGQAGYLAVFAAIAILTSALTLASFVKFFGASFLSRTSTLVSTRANEGRLEGGFLMQLPQAVLALICIVVGVFPALAVSLIQRALAASPHGFGDTLAAATPVSRHYLMGLADWQSAAVFGPAAIAVVLALGFGLAWTISRLGGSKRRATVPWLCGYAREADCHRYRAHGFYGEVKRYFHWLGGLPATHPPEAAQPGEAKDP